MCGLSVWERDPATSDWAESVGHWRKQASGRKEAREGLGRKMGQSGTQRDVLSNTVGTQSQSLRRTKSHLMGGKTREGRRRNTEGSLSLER